MMNNEILLKEMLGENHANQSDVKSIRRIGIILACVCSGIHSLADISVQSGLSRSTTHRLLQGMEKSHMVIHDPVNRCYYLGPLIRHLIARPQVTHEYLVNCAYREMERLGSLTEETIVLSVKIGLNHVSLHAVSSPHELRIVGPARMVGPLYIGAGGKVLLSQLSEVDLTEALKYIQLDFPASLNLEDLLNEVRQINKQGYAVTSGERVFGATFIAVPIKGYETPAALSIVGPDARMQPKIDNFLGKLLAAAERISKNLTVLSHPKR
jgi:DNA-binding IclR family transcriptional regulator